MSSLTLYAFSRENWKRPDFEVSTEARALLPRTAGASYADGEPDPLKASAALDAIARTALEETIAKTAGNDGMVLRLALSYGGRTEIQRPSGSSYAWPPAS